MPQEAPESGILDFYRDGPNPSGYLIEDILHKWTDDDWEQTHDFIQWVFPLTEPSMFNPDAPILTAEEIEIFRQDPELKRTFSIAIARWFRFLGLMVIEDKLGPGRAARRVRATEQKSVWSSPNHNWLRITRSLKSMRLLGHDDEARMFFDFLCAQYDTNGGITQETFQFWIEAMNG